MEIEQYKIRDLSSSLKGFLVLQNNANQHLFYDVCQIFNKLHNKKPFIVAVCLNSNDIIKVIQFVKENNLKISIKGGGHNVAGLCIIEKSVMIDLSQMKKIKLDLNKKSVKIKPGVLAEELLEETLKYNLFFTTPKVSSIGIVGFVLGGGIGSGSRKFGIACNNIISAKIITTDEKKRKIDNKNEKELFWAIKGAGSRFGIVTELELQLFSITPTLLTMKVVFPFDIAKLAIKIYKENEPKTPYSTEISCILLTEKEEKKCIFQGTYYGTIKEGEKIFENFYYFSKEDQRIIYKEKEKITKKVLFSQNKIYPENSYYYITTVVVKNITDKIIDILVKHFEEVTSNKSLIIISPGVSKGNESNSAFSYYNSYFIQICSCWDIINEMNIHIEWTKKGENLLKNFIEGYYVNEIMIDSPNQLKSCYSSTSWEKLIDLKKKYDPNNLLLPLE